MHTLIKEFKEQLEKDTTLSLESKVKLAKEIFFLEEAYKDKLRQKQERETWAAYIYTM